MSGRSAGLRGKGIQTRKSGRAFAGGYPATRCFILPGVNHRHHRPSDRHGKVRPCPHHAGQVGILDRVRIARVLRRLLRYMLRRVL